MTDPTTDTTDTTEEPRPRHYVLRQPAMAPFGVLLDESAVQEVWDTYIKPGQASMAPQSIEERALMAILRHVYAAMTGRELDRDTIARALASVDDVALDAMAPVVRDDYRTSADAVIVALTADVTK